MSSVTLRMALAAVAGGILLPVTHAAAAADTKEASPSTVRADRILFLGNSITVHGPAPQIGWSGNWGMAASAQEKDYVHLVLTRVVEAGLCAKPVAMIEGIAEFERHYDTYDAGSALKKAIEFRADLVVVAIGENVPAFPSEEAKSTFRAKLASLLGALKTNGEPALFVRSCFWPDKTKDEILRAACREAGACFVDISALARDESHYARSERKFAHAGVAAHPGDRGMKAIADALWEAIKARTSPAGARPSGSAM